MKTAQFNLEFVIFFVSSMIIMTALAFFFSTGFTESKEQRLYSSLNDVTYYLASEIQMASSFRDGYSKQLLLPERINNKNYIILLSQNRIWIEQGESSSDFFSVPFFSGSIDNINKSNNRISKKSGVVIIEREHLEE